MKHSTHRFISKAIFKAPRPTQWNSRLQLQLKDFIRRSDYEISACQDADGEEKSRSPQRLLPKKLALFSRQVVFVATSRRGTTATLVDWEAPST